MTVRADLAALIAAALPEGVYLYETPPESLKAPAVVIGALSWAPRGQATLEQVLWSGTIVLVVPRQVPAYAVPDLETLSVVVAQSLAAAGNVRVEEFLGDSTNPIGGTDYLTGDLSIVYSERF